MAAPLRRLAAALALLVAPAALAQTVPSAPLPRPTLYGDGPCAAVLDDFDAGLTAFEARDLDEARRFWTRAAASATCGPDAAYNLGILAVDAGDLATADRRFVETLDRLAAAPVPEDRRLAARTMRQLALAGLHNVAVLRLGRDSLALAEATFERLHARDSLHRDGWHNRALGRRAARDWRGLRQSADRLLAFDPLSAAAHTMRAEALRGLDDARAAARELALLRTLPLDVETIEVAASGDAATLTGTVQGKAAAPGSPVRLAVTLLSPDGPLATETVTVVAPPRGERGTFTLAFPRGAAGATAVRYRVLR